MTRLYLTLCALFAALIIALSANMLVTGSGQKVANVAYEQKLTCALVPFVEPDTPESKLPECPRDLSLGQLFWLSANCNLRCRVPADQLNATVKSHYRN